MICVQVIGPDAAATTVGHHVRIHKAREHAIQLLTEAVARKADTRSVKVAFQGRMIPDRLRVERR